MTTLALDPATAAANVANLSAVAAAKNAKLAKTDPKARAVAQDFEAVFLNNMFQHMFTAIDGDGPFGGKGAAGVWRSFLTDEYAKTIAKAGGIGIADHVYRSLIQIQEKSAR